MKKLLLIVGTRPEAIKLLPVYKALKADGNFIPLLMSTGQHGEAMMAPLYSFFDVAPDINLLLMKQNQSLNEFAALLLLALDGEIEKHEPDLVIVQGDTTTCMIGSLAAFYRRVKIAHVEAGLRTHNRLSPYPEEVNRRITSLITDFHFAPTTSAFKNLKNENVEGLIEVVGNTVIDSLLDACERIRKSQSTYEHRFEDIVGTYEKLILITGHRRENIGDHFREIYSAIVQLSKQHPHFAFVYPVHTNPSVRSLAFEMLGSASNIFLRDPFPYDDMVYLMQNSHLVMTDSGGIQEECPTLNKPVLVLRETTERPEGIEAGCSVIAGVTQDRIIDTFNKINNDEHVYRQMSSAKNPYGNGDASVRIVAFLKKHFDNL